ncbi:MAG: ABC transporter ATP-binding protein [Gemmatimonadaceae bacterium]|nr:ABC transporter ATP-binding protein [Gemmatimonadaceae bacterium]
METYSLLYGMLDGHERRRAFLVGAIMLVVSASEVAGVAAVLPFLSALANPAAFSQNKVVIALGLDRFSSHPSFMLWLGTAFLAVLILSLILRGIGAWALLRFASNRNVSWSSRLLERHLHQTYPWYIQQNSSELTASVISEVDAAVTEGLMPSLQVISQALVSAFIVTTLILANPVLAFAVAATMGFAFWLVSAGFRNRLLLLGKDRIETYNERLRMAQDSFVSFKEIRLAGLESMTVARFLVPSERRAQLQVQAGMLGQIPALAMQALLFGGLLGLTLFLLATEGSISSALPIIGLYAFAAYRLMPALQRLFDELAKLRAAHHAIARVSESLRSTTIDPDDNRALAASTFEHALDLRSVTLVYPGKVNPAVLDISLQIPAGSFVGIVGATGSGKSTLMDIILGLLPPTRGEILVDGRPLDSLAKCRAWQRNIGYVPQQIFLSDESIAANISFDSTGNSVDTEKLERAASLSCANEFIEALPERYETGVGDRGIRLSGGQRQRIGIARALYHDPHVLVLDEATSALDNVTEGAVMSSIRHARANRTVILIAHRLSTVRSCDVIFVMEGGRLVASGSYDDLATSCGAFQLLLRGGQER